MLAIRGAAEVGGAWRRLKPGVTRPIPRGTARYVVSVEARAGRRRYRLRRSGLAELEGEAVGGWVAPLPVLGLCRATIEGERAAGAPPCRGDTFELSDGTERYV